MEIIRWLIDASRFFPRSSCGEWTPWLVGVNMASNAAIAVAYFGMAGQLVRFHGKIRGRVGVTWIVIWIAAFIGACGATHVCDAAAFWAAPYRLFTAIETITAFLSVSTMLLLPLALDRLLKLPSVADLDAANRKWREAAKLAIEEASAADRMRIDAEANNRFLREKLQILEGRIRSESSYASRMDDLKDVRAILGRVLEVEANGQPPGASGAGA